MNQLNNINFSDTLNGVVNMAMDTAGILCSFYNCQDPDLVITIAYYHSACRSIRFLENNKTFEDQELLKQINETAIALLEKIKQKKEPTLEKILFLLAA